MSQHANTRLHPLPSGHGGNSKLLLGDALTVSESLGVVVVARGWELSAFYINGGQTYGTDGVMLPLLGSRSVSELRIDAHDKGDDHYDTATSAMNTFRSVRFLGQPKHSGKSMDLLAVVVGDRVFVIEMSFRAWFEAMSPQARLEQSESPLRWRTCYRSPHLTATESSSLSLSAPTAVSVIYFSSKRLKIKSASEAQYHICVVTAKNGAFVLEYHYYSSVKKQLESDKSQWARFYEDGLEIRSASLGARCVLLAQANNEVLCWRISTLLAEPAQRSLIQKVMQIRTTNKGARGTRSRPLLANTLAWVVPNSVLVVFKDDGSREVYKLDADSMSGTIVTAECLAIYSTMSTDTSSNVCFRTPTTCFVSDSHHQVWSIAGVRSTADADKPHVKLYSMQLDVNHGHLSVTSSLLDIVNTGVVRVPGANLLGSYLCTIQNRGSATNAKGETFKSSPVANAVARICAAPNLNGLAVVALTEKGIAFTSLTLPCVVPSKPAKKTIVAKQNEETVGENKPKAANDNSNQTQNYSIGSKVSPRSFIRAPMKTSSPSFGKRKPLSSATSARRSQAPSQLANAVGDLNQRVKFAELELTRLKTDFTSFTTEVSRAMEEINTLLKDRVVKRRHHQ